MNVDGICFNKIDFLQRTHTAILKEKRLLKMIIQGVNVANLMTYLINNVACIMEYENEDNLKRKELKEYYETVQKEMSKIDFNKLTIEQLEFLGFKKLSQKSEGYLVPLWILRVLPKGTKLKTILDGEVIVGVHPISNHTRKGCIDYKLIQV